MLKGRKVVLRPVEEGDLPLLVRLRNSEDNRPFFFNPWPVYPGGQKTWYSNLTADRSRFLMMIDTVKGRTVGMVGIANIDWRNQEAELGPGMLDAQERGNGFIEEALDLMLAYCFRELNLNRLYCTCYPFNRVIGMAKLFGFKEEGVLRQAAFTRGKFYDKILLGLLRQEWEEECGDAWNGK